MRGLMNLFTKIMSTINKKCTNDGSLKRVHTEVSDFTTSDEESMSLSFKKSDSLLNDLAKVSRHSVIQ